MGQGRGRRLQVDGAAITPEMARAVNDSVLVQEFWVETDTPPAVADVLALQFEERKEHKPSYQGRTWQVWRRKNIPELDWVDRTFGGGLISTH